MTSSRNLTATGLILTGTIKCGRLLSGAIKIPASTARAETAILTRMKRWSYSLIFLGLYLAVFHLWIGSSRPVIILSALVTTALLLAAFVRAAKRYYFVNHWDCWMHAVVILDVLTEGVLVSSHEGYSFYLCALAFAIVIGGYRGYILKNNLMSVKLDETAA